MLLDKLSILHFAGTWIWPGESSTVNPSIDTSSHQFSWDEIRPNKELVYHDCYGDLFQCARLQVPMDWHATEHKDNRTVEIAVIRVPATVPVTDPQYGGAVVINPGGPGGSGINLALKEGKSIQTVISAGPDEDVKGIPAVESLQKYFDVISFDPRGVNNTTPNIACFPDHIQMTEFQLESAAFGVFDSSDAAFGIHWAKMRAFAGDCSRRAVEIGIGEHMATASVARDIIEIFERHGQWREKEARRLLASPPPMRGLQVPLAGTHDAVETLERVRYRPGEEMVQYWGFSYGTILGATLAAMFPERISRAVFDGVADSFDYMKGEWLTNLQDTDMLIVKFGEYCWLGGPEKCALYDEDGPAAIIGKFAAIVADLKSNPIGVHASGRTAAGVATYGDLKDLFWQWLYKPLRNFHNLARIMNELSHGNGTSLAQAKSDKRKSIEEGLSEQCKTDGPYSRACFNSPNGWDASIATGILCTDAEPQTNITKERYWEYVEELMGQSRLIGDVWASIRVPCTQWHARPKWRYEGNFTARTAHPILFVSNTIDNVTPIRNAVRMSKGFEGSVVLQQDSEGHCSSASPSFCTARMLRNYFQTGELPKKGTICDPARLPLDGFSEEEDPRLPEGETDEELWRAMVDMSK